MYATTIRFSMPADTDWEALRQLLVRRAFEVFRTLPGLRAEAFIFSPERSEIGANHVWLTQDDAEAYLRSAAFRAAAQQWGEPRVERSEICAYVEDGDLVYPSEPPRVIPAEPPSAGAQP
jgi:hypothetical protein